MLDSLGIVSQSHVMHTLLREGGTWEATVEGEPVKVRIEKRDRPAINALLSLAWTPEVRKCTVHVGSVRYVPSGAVGDWARIRRLA